MAGHVRKRGEKWYYSFEVARVEGKRKRIERVGGRTKKDAERALRQALAEYEDKGMFLENSNISLSDCLDYWFNNYVLLNCRLSTQSLYISIIDHRIKPKLGQIRLKDLTPRLVQEFLDKLAKEGLRRSYIKLVFMVLHAVVKYAVYPCMWLKEDILQHVRIPKYATPSNQRRALMQEELTTVYEYYPENHPFRLVFSIAYYTGCRRAEILGLTWNDIDFENQRISINKGVLYVPPFYYINGTKTKLSERTILFGDKLAKILLRHRENCKKEIWQYENNKRIIESNKRLNLPELDMVCTYENGVMYNLSNLTTDTQKMNRNGIQFSLHMLRHTHATMLVERGVNYKTVQHRLGHSAINTTLNVYTHPTEQGDKLAVEVMEKPTTLL